jgi:hypothetical protein
LFLSQKNVMSSLVASEERSFSGIKSITEEPFF